MTTALIAAAYAMAVGLFGLAGMIMFWLTAAAVAFLIAMLLWGIEVLAARLARGLP